MICSNIAKSLDRSFVYLGVLTIFQNIFQLEKQPHTRGRESVHIKEYLLEVSRNLDHTSAAELSYIQHCSDVR